MKRLQTLLALALLLWLAVDVHARAAYKDKAAMIKTSQVIAIVDISAVEKVAVEGQHHTYGQKASAKVVHTLKGRLPVRVSLYGDEDFICAQCRFATGRYLVFLRRDGELLVGNNWQLSARKISSDNRTVEWFGGRGGFEIKRARLSVVLQEVARSAR